MLFLCLLFLESKQSYLVMRAAQPFSIIKKGRKKIYASNITCYQIIFFSSLVRIITIIPQFMKFYVEELCAGQLDLALLSLLLVGRLVLWMPLLWVLVLWMSLLCEDLCCGCHACVWTCAVDAIIIGRPTCAVDVTLVHVCGLVLWTSLLWCCGCHSCL